MRCLFVGRFQPFHKGHKRVVQKLLKKYDEIVIVIGSADSVMSLKNPFNSGERISMIRAAFDEKTLSRMIIVPLPDVDNHLIWVPYLISHTPEFEAVYSNNPIVKKLFTKAQIPVFSIKYINRKKHQGTTIRKLLKKGDKKWKKYVPIQVAKYILSLSVEDRFKILSH